MKNRSLSAVLMPSALAALAFVRFANAGTLLSFDFNGKDSPWPQVSTDVSPATPIPVEPAVAVKPVGTVDVAGTKDASGALAFTVEVGATTGAWEAVCASGPLALANQEADLAKLTLAFDCDVSMTRPVVVRIDSFDASGRRTGGLESTIYPAAPEFLQHFSIDLSTMRPHGDGKFEALAPRVQISYAISGPEWPSNATHTVRIDNVSLGAPTYYVSPAGSDANDGRSEARPLATIQHAYDLAKPGDVILLGTGRFTRPKTNSDQRGVVQMEHGGTPADWIVLKNAPGQTPVLFNDDAWDTIRVGGPPSDASTPERDVGYIEIRGLSLLGASDRVKQDHAADVGLARPTTNANAISIENNKRKTTPHHVRVADCSIDKFPGAGLGAGGGDYLQFEGNDVRDDCWYMIYAGSGISLLDSANFDAVDNVTKCLIRNNRVSGNRCYMPWGKIGRFSDGNGIIIDTNNNPSEGHVYLGRTLIQNNISVNNGGSAIHSFKSHRVDVVNNTAYLSAATPQTAWGQIFFQRADDVTMTNNVLVARPNQPVNTVSPDYSDKGNTNVVRADNLYFGGLQAIMGTDDEVADPKFVRPSTDPNEADFTPAPGSPAIGHGKWSPLTPLTDIDGHPRPLDKPPTAGAVQR